MNQMDVDLPRKDQTTEEGLRAEIERLKRELEAQKHTQPDPTSEPVQPSRLTLGALSVVGIVAIGVAFFAGYLPHQRREHLLVAEAKAAGEALPTVTVVPVVQAPSKVSLVLPGNMQALTEAPILARTSGYLRKRYVDIGDRVTEGQLVAEVEAPERQQEMRQGKAALQQSQSALAQSLATLQQGKTNEELARVTAQRWANLEGKGVVSRQENDTYQAQYKSSVANTQALEKAVSAARENVSAAEANLARLTELQSYRLVHAPFAGVVTQRNVDVGALVTEGSTLLFRIAQMNVVRTYVNVPQGNADSVRVGQLAKITVPDLPGREFNGKVTRTAQSLDPATRTLLTEVQVGNASGVLLPGMYAQVDLTSPVDRPPLLIPGDTLVVRPDGTQVAMLMPDRTIHFQLIKLGRDYGDRVEVIAGLSPGQRVVVNPGDTVREGAKVNPVLMNEKPVRSTTPTGASR